MKLDKISVNETLNKAEAAIKEEQGLSPAIRAIIEMLIMLIRAFTGRLSTDSSNSSTPPSVDKKRQRGSKKAKSGKKAGGQNDHDGSRLEPSSDPDEIHPLNIDKRCLPKGNYHDAGYEARQVIDFQISKIVTEYRAQILEDEWGQQHIAEFPAFVKTAVQYGYRVKSTAVYLSQFQLLPYARVQGYFEEKVNIPISTGSLFNFNQEAHVSLEKFDVIAVNRLINEAVLNADETGINVNKKMTWLHSVSSPLWSHFYPHEKRGKEAMDAMGIIPKFMGTLVHDHWKPYYTYSCTHSLCNAHHIRELTYAFEEDKQEWAEKMRRLLLEINDAVNQTERGMLQPKDCSQYIKKYRQIIADGEQECPLPEPSTLTDQPKRRGRIKKSKSRNLLERLREFESDVLRFMSDSLVPFTNNRGENDLRMTKVQQKISGCFRSMEGARIFCRVRGYLLTCQKHGIKMTEALELLFQGKMPAFVNDG